MQACMSRRWPASTMCELLQTPQLAGGCVLSACCSHTCGIKWSSLPAPMPSWPAVFLPHVSSRVVWVLPLPLLVFVRCVATTATCDIPAASRSTEWLDSWPRTSTGTRAFCTAQHSTAQQDFGGKHSSAPQPAHSPWCSWVKKTLTHPHMDKCQHVPMLGPTVLT